MQKLIDVMAVPAEAFGGDHRVKVAIMRVRKIERIKEIREKKIKVWK